MTDTPSEDQDRVVETALRLLPIPDHDPEFWARLDAALDASPSQQSPAAAPLAPPAPDDEEVADPATDEVPALRLEPVAPLGIVPPAMRRPSNLVLSALAVAAAVAVVVAGSALLRSRAADDPADEVAEAATQGTDEADPAEGTDPEPLTLRVPEGEPAAELVARWLGALAQGDIDAAWELLSPASQDSWGSSSAFAAERTALAEGYGAWSAASADEVIVTPLVEGELEVVTLVGLVEQEGGREIRADAFPVHWIDGEAVLGLYGDSGPVEIVAPAAEGSDRRRTVVAGDEIVIVVPDHGSDPLLRIGAGVPVVCGEHASTSLTHLEDAPARRCAYEPEGLEPGEHTLTVAHWSDDGTRVTAHSVRFTVL